jgi:hypothetical protein
MEIGGVIATNNNSIDRGCGLSVLVSAFDTGRQIELFMVSICLSKAAIGTLGPKKDGATADEARRFDDRPRVPRSGLAAP